MRMDWVNVALQGILLGGLYALFATGLALVFGVMRMVNLAHGDLGILAAFVALFLRGQRSTWAHLASALVRRRSWSSSATCCSAGCSTSPSAATTRARSW